MSKLRWWYCNTDKFRNFTYGKTYKGYVSESSALLNVLNDVGENTKPALFGYNGDKKIEYFVSFETWSLLRSEKISTILK